MKNFIAAAILACGGAAFSLPASAGVYADDETRCLVKSTGDSERLVLVKWIFAGIAAHPAIQQYANITPEQRAEFDKQASAVVTKLLTETCRTETVAALKYEGPVFLQSSFEQLGRIAMGTLTTNPQVQAALAQWTKTFDMQALRDLAKEAGRPMPAPAQ